MLGRFASVTLGDIGWSLMRGTAWVLAMFVMTNILGIEWSWKIVALGVWASVVDGVIYKHN